MSFLLFIVIFPLVFLPDVGISLPTVYGSLAPSDYVMPILYLFLLPSLLYRSPRPLFHRNLVISYFMFGVLTFLTTILIPLRYPQMPLASYRVIFGLLKLAKLMEYSFFGYLLARALIAEKRTTLFEMSLAAGCLLLSFSIFYNDLIGYEDLVYYLENGMALTIAVLVIYWIGSALRSRSRAAMYLKSAVVVILILAMLIEKGRGGWFAALTGIGYLIILRRPKARHLIIGAIVLASILYAHRHFVTFQDQIAKTFPHKYGTKPTSEFSEKFGIDDGARLEVMKHHLDKIGREPLLGAGFFNRSPESGLSWWGSHNFFLQMVLETGLLGLLCIVLVFYYLWTDAAARAVNTVQLETYRASIIAVIVGCQTGEYLYGGPVLLALAIVSGYYFATVNLAQGALIPTPVYKPAVPPGAVWAEKRLT